MLAITTLVALIVWLIASILQRVWVKIQPIVVALVAQPFGLMWQRIIGTPNGVGIWEPDWGSCS